MGYSSSLPDRAQPLQHLDHWKPVSPYVYVNSITQQQLLLSTFCCLKAIPTERMLQRRQNLLHPSVLKLIYYWRQSTHVASNCSCKDKNIFNCHPSASNTNGQPTFKNVHEEVTSHSILTQYVGSQTLAEAYAPKVCICSNVTSACAVLSKQYGYYIVDPAAFWIARTQKDHQKTPSKINLLTDSQCSSTSSARDTSINSCLKTWVSSDLTALLPFQNCSEDEMCASIVGLLMRKSLCPHASDLKGANSLNELTQLVLKVHSSYKIDQTKSPYPSRTPIEPTRRDSERNNVFHYADYDKVKPSQLDCTTSSTWKPKNMAENEKRPISQLMSYHSVAPPEQVASRSLPHKMQNHSYSSNSQFNRSLDLHGRGKIIIGQPQSYREARQLAPQPRTWATVPVHMEVSRSIMKEYSKPPISFSYENSICTMKESDYTAAPLSISPFSNFLQPRRSNASRLSEVRAPEWNNTYQPMPQAVISKLIESSALVSSSKIQKPILKGIEYAAFRKNKEQIDPIELIEIEPFGNNALGILKRTNIDLLNNPIQRKLQETNYWKNHQQIFSESQIIDQNAIQTHSHSQQPNGTVLFDREDQIEESSAYKQLHNMAANDYELDQVRNRQNLPLQTNNCIRTEQSQEWVSQTSSEVSQLLETNSNKSQARSKASLLAANHALSSVQLQRKIQGSTFTIQNTKRSNQKHTDQEAAGSDLLPSQAFSVMGDSYLVSEKVKQKVKTKNAVFAQLKAEARKILYGDMELLG